MKRERIAGIHALEAVLDTHPEQLIRVWIKATGSRLNALRGRLDQAGIRWESVDESRLERLADGLVHQGVVAEYQPAPPLTEHDLPDLMASHDAPLLLILDGVQDPHNLGACLRSAAAAGACAVITPRDRSAALTSAARRTAAGAAERVPLVVVTNLARVMRQLAKSGVWCVGLDASAPQSLFEANLKGSIALVLGGEHKGLRRLTAEHCDQLLHIPMAAEMESLNVSVAAGVALFSVVRARHLP